MAVLAFYDVDLSRGGSFDDQQKREYTRHHIAECGSFLDAEPEIWQHPLCPIPRVTKAKWDNLALCTNVKPTLRPHTRHPWRWDVVSEWSSLQFEQEKKENPLDDPAEIDIDSELVSKEFCIDEFGYPTVNTAGDLIVYKDEVPQIVINVVKNISIFKTWIKKIGGVVNNSPVRIKGELWDAGTLKVTKVRIGKDEWRNGIGFNVCRLEIRFDADGWVNPTLNRGYNEWVDDPEKKDKKGRPLKIKQRCVNDLGQPETNPVFLDAKGSRPRETYLDHNIPKTRPKLVLDPSDIVLLRYQRLKKLDFNSLPLV